MLQWNCLRLWSPIMESSEGLTTPDIMIYSCYMVKSDSQSRVLSGA